MTGTCHISFKKTLLIHLANPQSWPVGIIVFAHVVRTSFQNCLTKQKENNALYWRDCGFGRVDHWWLPSATNYRFLKALFCFMWSCLLSSVEKPWHWGYVGDRRRPIRQAGLFLRVFHQIARLLRVKFCCRGAQKPSHLFFFLLNLSSRFLGFFSSSKWVFFDQTGFTKRTTEGHSELLGGNFET